MTNDSHPTLKVDAPLDLSPTRRREKKIVVGLWQPAAPVEPKNKMREQIAAEVAEFIEKGGRIECVAAGKSNYYEFNGRQVIKQEEPSKEQTASAIKDSHGIADNV